MLLTPARHREASAEAEWQFGDLNAQHFMNLFSKSGQNRSQKIFYEIVNSEVEKKNRPLVFN